MNMAHPLICTGGSSGIGLATAKLLSESGAWVTLMARNEDPLQTAALQVNGPSYFVMADLANAEELKFAAERAVSRNNQAITLCNAEYWLQWVSMHTPFLLLVHSMFGSERSTERSTAFGIQRVKRLLHSIILGAADIGIGICHTRQLDAKA
jgi:NAD(P)-dependent dehydrogenase (short-subunit alcohol dehydrogenase family)